MDTITQDLMKLRRRSNDPDTQCSAIIYSNVIIRGYNYILGPYTGRKEKRERSIHAEVSVIAQAAERGHKIDSTDTLHISGTPCLSCAKLIIAANIGHVVIYDSLDPFKDRLDDPHYKFDVSLELLNDYLSLTHWDTGF
jgi:tRNA(Arg) A34 adenosine deaminase TadA